MDDMILEIKSFIDNNNHNRSQSDDFLLMDSRYEPIKIDSNNFHEITNTSKLNKTISLFVDGGNSVLFESANFCLGFIRIVGLKYENNKRTKREKQEFYVFVKEENEKFKIKTFPESKFNNLVFNPDDNSLKTGNERCKPSKIISTIRRFAELELAYKLNSDEINFIFLDGTLDARYDFEIKYINKLISTKKACALSKTCSLTTKNGEAITKKLFDLNDNLTESSDCWYFHPLVKNKNQKHPADIYFIKLNENSKYVFRFEIQNDFTGNLDELFFFLKSNSNDAVFLGYPYGLIDVDAAARISDEESKMLKTKFMVKMGKDWNDFSKSLNSMNAHDVLDKIKF